MSKTLDSTYRKRSYALPLIQDLSDDQERVTYLPDDGCHLVVGGPGTGKSVVCLLRARVLKQKKLKHIFLVYNKVLKMATLQLADDNKILINTYLAWFNVVFKQLTACYPSRLNSDDFNSIDWDGCIDKLLENDDTNQSITTGYDGVIVDEGQDMQKGFYLSLITAGLENIFVSADQNQQITNYKCSRQDLEEALSIETSDVVELTINYRNTYPVARFAQHFYPDDPASPKVNLPKNRPSLDIPMLIIYGNSCRLCFEDVIYRILLRVDRKPRELIGIITFYDKTREKYVTHLQEANQSRSFDNGPIPIQTYSSKNKDAKGGNYLNNIQFGQGGIMVLNAMSCKGLEFDTVFIADIHEFPCKHGSDDASRLFYVMSSRARERLFLLKDAGRHCPIESILPQDETILRRWSGS